MARFVSLFMLFMALFILSSQAMAGGNPALRFYPASQTILRDSSGMKEVRIDSVAALKGFSVRIKYDPSIAAVDRVRGGTMFGSPLFFASFVDSVDGVITVESALLGSGRGVDGSGVLFIIELTGKREGRDTLAFLDADLRDVRLSRIEAELEGAVLNIGTPSSVEEEEHPRRVVKLFQNYPNPFNPVTEITYILRESSFVTLDIFCITGGLIERLVVSEEQSEGIMRVTFDAAGLPSGIYFYRIIVRSADNSTLHREAKRMMLVK